MKKGFTIVEVSILFVIFLIVAFLVAPLTFDDTLQARNTYKWRNVQQDFLNILYNVSEKTDNTDSFIKEFEDTIINTTDKPINDYRITSLNGTILDKKYHFDNYRLTHAKATISIHTFQRPENGILGVIMYDVNGSKKPNTWGKDVFGFNIYEKELQPFGKDSSLQDQRNDCSKNGTGLSCSNYFLIGGDFDR